MDEVCAGSLCLFTSFPDRYDHGHNLTRLDMLSASTSPPSKALLQRQDRRLPIHVSDAFDDRDEFSALLRRLLRRSAPGVLKQRGHNKGSKKGKKKLRGKKGDAVQTYCLEMLDENLDRWRRPADVFDNVLPGWPSTRDTRWRRRRHRRTLRASSLVHRGTLLHSLLFLSLTDVGRALAFLSHVRRHGRRRRTRTRTNGLGRRCDAVGPRSRGRR